jgi:radial spoke head protein 4A
MADPAEGSGSFLKGVTRDADALYEHLTKVLLKIVKESPTDALSAFESLSVQVKEETAAAAALSQAEAVVGAAEEDADTKTATVTACQSTLDLIKPPKKLVEGGEDGEEPEEEEEPEKAPMPNVMEDFGLLRHAGVGLAEEEVYRLTLSLQTLTTKNELQNVRFWGKVHGTEKDYYVVEAKLEEYPEPEEGSEAPPKQEAMGSGCNECIYFATNSPEEPWTKLKPVQPEHITAARRMRRFFTGSLEAPVLGFPRFPWGEGAYLRTQIARICADALLCPVGQFNLEGEEDEDQTVAENEEWGGVDVLSQDSDRKWLHARPGIMSEGRCTLWVDPDKEEEEEEDEMSEEKKAALAAIEKPRKKLAAVGDDGAEATFAFRTAPSKFDRNAASLAFSLVWPGAVSLVRGKKIHNFYAGWGLPLSLLPYAPPQPPAFAAEYVAEEPLLEETDVLPPDGKIADTPEEEEEDDALEEDGDKPDGEAAGDEEDE